MICLTLALLAYGAFAQPQEPVCYWPQLTEAEVRDLIDDYDWYGLEDVALCIAWSESKYRPWVIGKAGERSIWQEYPGHRYRYERRGWDYETDSQDSAKATAIAHEIFLDSRFTLWTTAKGCLN